MERLLIIGANGQLGQDCRRLFSPSLEVKCVDLPDIDITDLGSVAAQVAAFQPDAVVNCAAWTAVDKAESNEEICARVNALGPANIARALAEAGGGAVLVHISTDYVFDGSKPLFEPYVEDDPPNPVSAYGRTKLAGERPVLEYAKGAVLRTAWLYGETGANFLRTMLRLALRTPATPIRVVDDQWGSPTWSGSLARQIQALLGRFTPGLYHATSQGHCTWCRLADRFLECAGVDHEVVPIATADYPTPARRPANSILDNRNLRALGIDVMPNWEDDLVAFARRVAPHWIEELRA